MQGHNSSKKYDNMYDAWTESNTYQSGKTDSVKYWNDPVVEDDDDDSPKR